MGAAPGRRAVWPPVHPGGHALARRAERSPPQHPADPPCELRGRYNFGSHSRTARTRAHATPHTPHSRAERTALSELPRYQPDAHCGTSYDKMYPRGCNFGLHYLLSRQPIAYPRGGAFELVRFSPTGTWQSAPWVIISILIAWLSLWIDKNY